MKKLTEEQKQQIAVIAAKNDDLTADDLRLHSSRQSTGYPCGAHRRRPGLRRRGPVFDSCIWGGLFILLVLSMMEEITFW